eukprot:COSAG02_NODE_152_length_33208_cov_13.316591_17_plen_89_part_00
MYCTAARTARPYSKATAQPVCSVAAAALRLRAARRLENHSLISEADSFVVAAKASSASPVGVWSFTINAINAHARRCQPPSNWLRTNL